MLLPNTNLALPYTPLFRISPLCEQNITIQYIKNGKNNPSATHVLHQIKPHHRYQYIRMQIIDKDDYQQQVNQQNKNQLIDINKNIRAALNVINKYDGNTHIIRAQQPFRNNDELLSYFEVQLCTKQYSERQKKQIRKINKKNAFIKKGKTYQQIQAYDMYLDLQLSQELDEKQQQIQGIKSENKQSKIQQQQQQYQPLGGQQNIWKGLNIGLTIMNYKSQSYNLLPVPGKVQNSIGIQLPNSIYQNNQKIDQLKIQRQLITGDIIGIGFIPHKQLIFITLNGQQLQENTIYLQNTDLPFRKQQSITLEPLQYYPTICLSHKYQSLKLIFENNAKQFKYNYHQKLLKLTCQLNDKINSKSQADQSSLYKMMHDYLRFHGYLNSSFKLQRQMMKKNIRFTVAKFPKNKQTHAKLIEEQLKVKQQEGKQQQQKKKKKKINKKKEKKKRNRNHSNSDGVSDDESQESLHFGDTDYQQSDPSTPSQQDSDQQYTFQVFMRRSDYLPPDMRPKKNKKIQHPIQRKARRQRQKLQKQQMLRKQHQVIYAKQKQVILEERQKNMRLHRTNILKQIRQGKLEVAQRTFLANIPQIYKNYKFLEIYFKVHIFLKKFKIDGLKIALEYFNPEMREQISKYQNNLFPFYQKSINGGQPYILKPLKNIFVLITTESQETFNFDKQLVVFEDFISKIICEKIGYMEISKLQYAINHFSFVKQICDKSKIPCTNRNILMKQKIGK